MARQSIRVIGWQFPAHVSRRHAVRARDARLVTRRAAAAWLMLTTGGDPRRLPGPLRWRLAAQHPIAALREPADQPIRLDRIGHPRQSPSPGRCRIQLSSSTLRGRCGRTAAAFRRPASARARDNAAAPRSDVWSPRRGRPKPPARRRPRHFSLFGPRRHARLPLTMIKDTLTSGFFRYAKPIG